jgi:hypothetical protein
LTCAQQRDEAEPEYLVAEALVHFIRRADRNNDLKLRDDLFRELFERCKPAYQALEATGADQCGLTKLAGRTVGAPFVGAVGRP